MNDVMNGDLMVAEKDLEKEIAPVLSVAREIVVKDSATYEMAGQSVKELTSLEKKIKEFWAPEKEMASKLHKSLVAKEKAMLDPVGVEKSAKVSSMRAWQDEQERARRAAQALAEAEAKKRAEEAALAHAVALEAAGDKAGSEAVLSAPVVAPPVYIPPTTPTGYGQFTKKTWKADVFDLMALVKAIAAGTAPIQSVQADTVFLNQQARALKSAMNISGVRALEL